MSLGVVVRFVELFWTSQILNFLSTWRLGPWVTLVFFTKTLDAMIVSQFHHASVVRRWSEIVTIDFWFLIDLHRIHTFAFFYLQRFPMASPIFSMAFPCIPMDQFPPKKVTIIPRFQGVVIGETVCKKWGGNPHLPKIIWFWPFNTVSPFAGHAPSLPGTPLKVAQIFKVRWRKMASGLNPGWRKIDRNWAGNLEGCYKKGDFLLGAMAFWSIFHIFFFEGEMRTGISIFFSRFKTCCWTTAGFTLLFLAYFFRNEGWKGQRDGQYQIIGVPFCGHGWSPVVFARGEQVNMRKNHQKTPLVIPYTLSLNLWV